MGQPSILYKYRDWSNPNHRAVLDKNEFYFSSPADINDPFDFQVSPDLSLLDTQIKKQAFIDELLNDAIKILREKNINHNERARILLYRLDKDLDKMQDEYDLINSNYTNNRFGVISFSYRWDSILMWSHYANNHKGFCVGLKRDLVEGSNLYDSAGPVNYQNDFPRIDPLNNTNIEDILNKTHTKAKEWEYEQEYRLVKLWVHSNPDPDDRKMHVPNNFIHEIILGKNINIQHKEEIIKLANLKKVPVYQIAKKRRTFLLEKVKI